MRLTIIADDGAVYVDGVAFAVDLSGIDPAIHAVQWNDGLGEIEYRADLDGRRRGNAPFVDIAPFQPFIERWHAAAAIVVAPVPAPASRGPVNVIAE